MVAADGSSAPAALHAAEFSVAALVALVPGADVALVESIGGGDHSLYAVPLNGSGSGQTAKPMTPVDDVGERLVGFVAGPLPAVP